MSPNPKTFPISCLAAWIKPFLSLRKAIPSPNLIVARYLVSPPHQPFQYATASGGIFWRGTHPIDSSPLPSVDSSNEIEVVASSQL